MKTYRWIVTMITAFFGGVSGVFLVSGAGGPGLRIMVGVVFFVCFLNLSIYAREFGRWCRRSVQNAAAAVAGAKPGDQKSGDQKPGEGKGGGGQGGGGQGNGKPSGGEQKSGSQGGGK